MSIVIATILYGIFFVSFEVIAAKLDLRKETSRKTVHILTGISVAFLPFVLSFREIIYLSLLFIPLMLVSKKANILSSIHQVKRSTYGEVYFPVAVLIMALVFPDRMLYMYGLLIMAISDGFAGVIGQKYGKRKYKLLYGDSSYAGSLTFFLSAIAIGSVVMLAFGTAVLPALALSILMAAALTAVEGCLSLGLDNLVLAPVAGGLMSALMALFSLR